MPETKPKTRTAREQTPPKGAKARGGVRGGPAASTATKGTRRGGDAARTSAPVRRPAGRTAPAPSGGLHRGRAPRAPFVLLVLGLLGGGLVSLLLLNTVLAKDSFRVNDLLNSTRQLREQAEAIENQNRVWEQPQVVAEQGERYGLEFDEGAPEFVSPAPVEDAGR